MKWLEDMIEQLADSLTRADDWLMQRGIDPRDIFMLAAGFCLFLVVNAIIRMCEQ